MFITTHAAIGALFAEIFPNHPVLAFFAGFASHFLIDIVPHGDTHLYKGYIAGSRVKIALAFVVVDAVAAVILTALLMGPFHIRPEGTLAAGITGSVLPDALVAIYEVTKARWLAWFHRVHFFFHNLISGRVGDLSLWTGVGLELVILALFVFKVA